MSWFFTDWKGELERAEHELLEAGGPWQRDDESFFATSLPPRRDKDGNMMSPMADAEPSTSASSKALPEQNIVYACCNVDLSAGPEGQPRSIRTIKAFRRECATEMSDVKPLVLVHGYGQGCASFWRNLRDLAERHPSGVVYAIDWLGCGLSSRPEWPCGDRPDAADDWFAASIHDWRARLGFNKFHLVGHSMGAMIAVAYSERHADAVESLVLASPAGVPRPPEMTTEERLAGQPFFRRMLFKTATSLWEGGSTPHGFVRCTGGFLGKGVISGYVNRRFEEDVPDKPLFAEYMYRHWQGDASGERALQAMLYPGVIAKNPLCDRVPKLSESIPVSFIYGDRDWMTVDHAIEMQQNHRDRRYQISTVNHAGHQLFIDRPIEFNDRVLEATSVKD